MATHRVQGTCQIDLEDRKIHHVFDSFLDMLLRLLAHRDHYTYLHSMRVAELSRRIGLCLGLDKDEILTLEHGALIHDVGKLSIPDDVLLKPGRFSNHDRCIMNSHPLIGAQLFDNKGIDERLVEIILRHHERLDGSGYPDGLTAQRISIFPRIVAVADIYEALIARRPYKPERTRAEALEILLSDVHSGKLDAEATTALASVTGSWCPLSIQEQNYPEDLARLEGFRHSCYFREPLSQFYSYRYLFAFEENRANPLSAMPYSLFALCFHNLKTLNRERGYLETDSILCSIGEELQRRISLLAEYHPDSEAPLLLFLKKGADFIIYNRYEYRRCQQVRRLIRKCIDEAKSKWEVECECRQRRFLAGEPFVEALDLIFTQDEDCAAADTSQVANAAP